MDLKFIGQKSEGLLSIGKTHLSKKPSFRQQYWGLNIAIIYIKGPIFFARLQKNKLFQELQFLFMLGQSPTNYLLSALSTILSINHIQVP